MFVFFTLTLTTAGSTEFAMFPPVGIGIKLAKEEKRKKKKKTSKSADVAVKKRSLRRAPVSLGLQGAQRWS